MPNRNSSESIRKEETKSNSDYYEQLTITSVNSLRSQAVMREHSLYNPKIILLMHVEALTRLHGYTCSEPFLLLASLLHPHPRDHFLAGLSARDFLQAYEPHSAVGLPSSIPAKGGNLVCRKRWMDDLFNSISVVSGR